MPRNSGSFATFLIIGPTCFFLGILFIMLPYDYYVLWSPPPVQSPISAGATVSSRRAIYLDAQETHLRILHASPPLIGRILNLVIGTGLLGFFIKLYRPTEANMLFDGASLVLYMAGVVVYLANTVKGLRAASAGAYAGENNPFPEGVGGRGGLGTDDEVLTREDSLRVLAASNTILALVLVGILILQAGQWYAQRKEEEEMREMRKKSGKVTAAKKKT